MKSIHYTALLVAAAVALSATAVKAQGPGGGGGFGRMGGMMGGGGGMDPSFLLLADPVQKELELSDDQKTSLQKFRDDMMTNGRDFFQQLQGLSQDEIQKKMADRAKENRKKIADILLPPQMDRLDQISLQVAGASALTRDDVAEKLGLKDDQKSKLKDIADDSRQKMMDQFQSYGGPPADDQERQERTKKMTEIRTEQSDKSLAVLTSDQKTKFEEMQGKKFDTTQLQNGRGFGRGPGGGGPGGGSGGQRPGGGQGGNGPGA